MTWSVQPGCGAVVTLCGTVRDHSEGRSGIVSLEYEAYLEQVEPRLAKVAPAARAWWPEVGRLVLLHRVGRLEVGEVSVDAVTECVPIRKRETRAEGSEWTECSHDLVEQDQDEIRAADRVPVTRPPPSGR